MRADVRNNAILFAVIYGVMGASGIVGQAIASLTKDGLRLSASQSAVFAAAASSPAYFAPLYGFFSDTFPICGTRRKGYLILSGLLGAMAWVALGTQEKPGYVIALALLATALLMLDISITIANGLMVEAGKRAGRTGFFQSVQWGAANSMSLFGTLFSGFILKYSGGAAAFRLYAVFPLIAAGGAAILTREPRNLSRTIGRIRVVPALKAAFASRAQWMVALFLLGWFFSPGLGTALYYYERDHLGFEPTLIGVLGAVFQGAGILGAVCYARLANRFPVRSMLRVAVVLGTLGHLAYLTMVDRYTAIAASALDGGLSLFSMLVVFDLGARAAPPRVEGTSFAILTTVRAVALLSAGVVGGYLYDRIGMHVLILVSATFTAACGFLIRWLPGPPGSDNPPASGDNFAPDLARSGNGSCAQLSL